MSETVNDQSRSLEVHGSVLVWVRGQMAMRAGPIQKRQYARQWLRANVVCTGDQCRVDRFVSQAAKLDIIVDFDGSGENGARVVNRANALATHLKWHC